MANLSDQLSKTASELLSSSVNHHRHYRNPRRTKSITSRRYGTVKKAADEDLILDSDIDESSSNSSCLLEIGSEPDIAYTSNDKVIISDSYSTPNLIGICRDDDRGRDFFRSLEGVGISTSSFDRLQKGHEQENALLAFVATDVHPGGNLTDKKGAVNFVPSGLQEANKPDQTKASSIIEAESEAERKTSLIGSEINNAGADTTSSSTDEAGAENFSPISCVKNSRNCLNVAEQNAAIFDEKVDSPPAARSTSIIAAATAARLKSKFSLDDKEENCELSEKRNGKRESSSFYQKADIIVGPTSGNAGENEDFIRDKVDLVCFDDESKANNFSVTDGQRATVEGESTVIAVTSYELGCGTSEGQATSNILLYENNDPTSLKSDTLVEETIVEEPQVSCVESMSGLLLPVAPPKTPALYPVGHYHGVKRGPRHISGDNAVTVRNSRGNNFIQGGSERELSYHDFSKDYFYKRWSLAGAGPELALMRVKLEQVQRELDELRSKHERKLNDYQALLKQLDMAHETRVNLENDLQVACAEISRLKFDNDHLSQQTMDIQVQMQRVQRERDEIIAGQSTANDLAQKLMIEYEELRMDRDNYRRRCHELENNCANLQQSLVMSRDEERIIRLQYENRLETQRQKMDDTLERTQSSNYQQFQKLAQERDMFRANLDVLHQEFEDSLANNSRLQLNLQQRDDELQALKLKHKSLSAEYNRIMEERNKVLEENERLSDETGRQALLEQNRKLEIQVKYLQEREEYYRKIGSTSQQPSLDQPGSLYVDINKRYNQDFDDESTSVSSRRHDHAFDDLKRQMDGLKEQYESSRQELESAKQMREWALVERQRIVAERDSIRAMCDELRRDRDNAVTKLADAFRDTEELQRYKEQAERELKRMRDRLDLDSKSKNSATDSPTSPSHSRDSAIDSDMAEWEIETLTIDVIGSQKTDNLGVELRGGRDDPIFGQIVPIYVKSVEKNSKFDGILRVYDCIMQVNNIDVANMERRSVMDILKNSNSGAMVIKRRRLIGMKLISVSLDSNDNQDFGLLFDDGVYVTRIKTSSLAAKSENLAVGDRLIYINDTPVEGKTAQEVDRIIRSYRGSNLVLTVVKSPPILSPMTPSTSFISSSYSTPNNNGVPNTTNGFKNTTTTTTTFATTMLPNVYNPGQRFQLPTSKDEGIQVVLDKSVGHQTVKKESLLDKVHDKLFGKNERKSTVRAYASIPNDFDDKKTNACCSSPHTPATISTATASSSGILGTRLRLRSNAAGGSERAAPSCSRYTKTPSICSATFSNPPSQQKTLADDAGDAQLALQQLDSVLEASEREYADRRVSKVPSTVFSPYSGGTWPKLRPISHPTPELLAPSFMDEVTPLPVITPIKRAKERKHLLPFLFNGPISSGSGNAQSPLMTLRSRHEMERKSAQSKSHPHEPCFVDQNFGSKSRPHDSRPMSYHPSMTNQYYNFGHFSSQEQQQQQNQDSSDEMVTTNDSLNSSYHHRNNSQQKSYTLTNQNRPTNFSNGRSTSGAKNKYVGQSPNGSSGGVAGRRPRVLSQYDPVYANLVEDNFSSISRRHNQPFFVKNLQHGPPRYKPPPPACAFSSSTPCSSSSFGQQNMNAMTANMTNSSSVEQDMDAQSITSQSSGFSRCGLKNNFFYNSQASKSSVQAKIDASRYQSDEYSSSYQSKLSQGDVRTITLEKRNSHEFLGITVARANSGNGIFVSSVSENSLAAKHGVQVGDQLLEVCGINMRSADTYYANNVLRNIPQQDIDVSLVVQYNPERYFGNVQSATSYSTTTPRATPSSFADKSREYTLKSQASQRSHDIMSVADSANSLRHAHHQPRIVYVKKENSDWGFTLIGGNAIGIFVDELKSDSPAYGPDGLMNGDQILEFDDLNFRKLTLEQALFELNQRPCDSLATLRVQYNEAKYQKCKTGAGDSFYIQVNVERKAENNDELSYKVGDVLRVDNTVFNGVAGLWRAWLIDQEGREISCGIIPSKSKLEEAYAKTSASEISGCLDGSSENGGSRRGTIRRSWKFIRRSSRTTPTSSNAPPPSTSSTAAPNHQRTSSKDSRDLIADPSSSLLMHDEPYQRVERIDYKKKRPVLILGPLSDIFIAKLLEDYPKIYSQCVPECVQPDLIRKLDHGVEHVYVDCRKRDKLYEVTSFSALKEIMEKGFHCILHINVAAVERLRRLHIYPVVIFVKFKNAKQIKEISEDKISSKQAKEMFESANRMEIEYFQFFSSVIQGPHNNVKYICQQIVSAVEHEQKKTLWVASNETL